MNITHAEETILGDAHVDGAEELPQLQNQTGPSSVAQDSPQGRNEANLRMDAGMTVGSDDGAEDDGQGMRARNQIISSRARRGNPRQRDRGSQDSFIDQELFDNA